jgi:hypothetical protein
MKNQKKRRQRAYQGIISNEPVKTVEKQLLFSTDDKIKLIKN